MKLFEPCTFCGLSCIELVGELLDPDRRATHWCSNCGTYFGVETVTPKIAKAMRPLIHFVRNMVNDRIAQELAYRRKAEQPKAETVEAVPVEIDDDPPSG